MEHEVARRRTLYLTIVAAVVLYLAYLARAAVVPLFVALLLAYVLAPLVAALERRRFSRLGAVATLFVAFFGTTGVALFFGLPPLVEQGRALLRATLGEPVVTLGAPLPATLEGIPDRMPPMRLAEFLPLLEAAGSAAGPGSERFSEGSWDRRIREAREMRDEESVKEIRRRHADWLVVRQGDRVVAFDDWNRNARFDRGYVFDATVSLSRYVREHFRNPALASAVEDLGIDAAPGLAETLLAVRGDVARNALDVLGAVSLVLAWVLIIPLYTFYFLMRLEDVWAAFVGYLPGAYRDRVIKVLTSIHRMLIGFFRGRLLTMLVKGIYVALGLAVIGVPYWPVFGAAAGLLTIIPVVGPALAAVPAVALTYREGGTVTAGLAGAFLLSAEFVEGYILIPKMIGKEVGLHPMAVISAILIGGALLGAFGIVIAIPLAASAKIVWGEFVLPAIRAKAAESPRPPGAGTVA